MKPNIIEPKKKLGAVSIQFVTIHFISEKFFDQVEDFKSKGKFFFLSEDRRRQVTAKKSYR